MNDERTQIKLYVCRGTHNELKFFAELLKTFALKQETKSTL